MATQRILLGDEDGPGEGSGTKSWEECIAEATSWAEAADGRDLYGQVKSVDHRASCAQMASAWVAIANAVAGRQDPVETYAETYAGELAELREQNAVLRAQVASQGAILTDTQVTLNERTDQRAEALRQLGEARDDRDAEIRRYNEVANRAEEMVRRADRERDEARAQCSRLTRENERLTELHNELVVENARLRASNG